jgi:hypothetical protein
MKEIPCLNLCDIMERYCRSIIDQSMQNAIDTEIPNEKIKRIYIGSYFCGKYFIHMDEKMIGNVIDYFSHQIGVAPGVTLVVPMFSQHDLTQGKEKIDKLLQSYKNYIDEITVNDYGMLESLANYPNYAFNLGRLFMKDYRDPRFKDNLSQTLQPKIFTDFFMNHYKQYGIKGAEFDPTHLTIDFSQAPKDIHIGLHYPFCYVTTGQICEFASIPLKADKKYRPNMDCSGECRKHHILYSPKENILWLRLGRTIYSENNECTVIGIDEIKKIYFPLKELNLIEKGDARHNEDISTCQ